MEIERVAADFSGTLDVIPDGFMRSIQEEPALTTFTGPVPEIPTIDFSDPDHKNLVQTIANASRDWALFQIVNHGIPAEVIGKLQKVGREFFELPLEEKEKIAKPADAKSFEGYGTRDQKELEGKKTWVDHLFHNVWPPPRINYHFWPKNPPPYREANKEYVKCMREVVDRLFLYLSLGLGVEGNVLKEAVGGEHLEYLLKINYYPPCPRPDLTLGVPSHTDMSAITVLVPNEVPGLQVLKHDHWFDAKCIPNALIIHIGDQVEILSNGKYKAVLHRTVVTKDKTRMSWPIFCSPPEDLVLGPLPQLVDAENATIFKTKKYKDYVHCKLNKLPQ